MITDIKNILFQVGLIALILAVISYLFIDQTAAIVLSEFPHSNIVYKSAVFIDSRTSSKQMIYIELLIGAISSWLVLHGNNALARKFSFIFLCYFIAYLVTFAIKMLIARYRPELFLSDQLYGFSWFNASKAMTSMPSGHASVNFALALSVSIILFAKHRFFCLVLILYSIAVAISRVVINAHYISDILISLTVTSWVIIYVFNISGTYSKLSANAKLMQEERT